MTRGIVSEAIVLSSRPYSEADKIVSLFSKNFGKITVIAKGVKRLKSRKRGSLEVFSYIKFSAHTGKGLPIITETEMINNYSDLRKDLKRVSVAYFFAEVVLRTTRDEEKHEEVFDLLVYYLQKLEVEKSLKRLRNEFSIELAETLGFIPKGAHVPDADELLESIIERKLGSVRVGRKLQR